MGKGSIVSGGEEGLYTVEKKYMRARIDAQILQLTNKINAIAVEIADPDTTDARKEDLFATLATLESKKRILTNAYHVPDDETVQMWCADYTENLEGDVGLAVIAYQDDLGLNILPGYAATGVSPAVYDSSRDGQLGNGFSTTPLAAYYSWIMLPFCQLHRPRFRYATILDIDYNADTCQISLEIITSRAQGIEVTKPYDLDYVFDDVPIEYMNCDSYAFDIGDVVLVKFQNYDWDSPKVIGFKDHPRQCYYKGICVTEVPILLSGAYTYIAMELVTSDPCDPGGSPEPTQLQAPVTLEGFPGWDFNSPIIPYYDDPSKPVERCNGEVVSRGMLIATLPPGDHNVPDFPAGMGFGVILQPGSMAVMPGTTVKLYSSYGCVGEPFAIIEGGQNGRMLWYDHDYFRELEAADCKCRGWDYYGNIVCRNYSFEYCTDSYLDVAMGAWTGTIAEVFSEGPELVPPLEDWVVSIRIE